MYTQAAIVNNTKRSSPGEGKWSLKLVAIEIEPRPFSGPGHSGNHGGERMLEARTLTFLWKHWNCLKWGETNIAVFRHHVPLHNYYLFYWRIFRRQNRTNSCQLFMSKMETENKLECCAFIQVFIVFPPPPPHFYCFSLLLLLISIVFYPSPTRFIFFSPRDSIKDCQLPSLVHFEAMARVSWLPCFSAPVCFKDSYSTTTTCTIPSLIQCTYGTHSYPRRK